jgi:cell division protein FtsB
MKHLGWVIFFLVVIYFVMVIRQDIIDNLELKKEIKQTAEKLNQETQYQQKLKEQLKGIESGERVEELARTRLGLIKKGETAYKVIL